MELDVLFHGETWARVTVDTLIRSGYDGLDCTLFWKRGKATGSLILRRGLDIERQGIRLVG